MKRFVAAILTFFIFNIVILVSLLVITNAYIYRNANFRLKKKSTYAVVGHSHPQAALNDSLIASFSNCAKSADSYFYIFTKLKRIIADNKEIRTVFIDVTDNQFADVDEAWIWGTKMMNAKYPLSASLFSNEDNLFLLYKNPIGFLNAITRSLVANIKNSYQHDLDYVDKMGGYKYIGKANINDTTSVVIPKPYDTNPRRFDYARINILYLTKIIQFCHGRGIKTVLIRCPLNKRFAALFNEKNFQENMQKRLGNNELLDFKNFPLPDSAFFDVTHLNFRGAYEFSVFFQSLLADSLLEKSNKQAYIDQRMKDLQKITTSQ